jgi:hypothetical protein
LPWEETLEQKANVLCVNVTVSLVELAVAKAPTRRRVWASGDAGPFAALMSSREKSEITIFFNNRPLLRFAGARSIKNPFLQASRGGWQVR